MVQRPLDPARPAAHLASGGARCWTPGCSSRRSPSSRSRTATVGRIRPAAAVVRVRRGRRLRSGFGTGGLRRAPAAGRRRSTSPTGSPRAPGNVAADSITRCRPALAGSCRRATNPFAADRRRGRRDRLEQVRAPRAARVPARQFRAVRAEDYNAAARGAALGARRRHGVALDRELAHRLHDRGARGGGAEPSTSRRADRAARAAPHRWLRGLRPLPRYVGPRPGGDRLRAAVGAARRGRGGGADRAGHRPRRDGGRVLRPGAAPFGTPLERSDLEAAVQAAVGVARRRASSTAARLLQDFVPMPETVAGRARRDHPRRRRPDRPDLGSLRVVVQGGK